MKLQGRQYSLDERRMHGKRFPIVCCSEMSFDVSVFCFSRQNKAFSRPEEWALSGIPFGYASSSGRFYFDRGDLMQDQKEYFMHRALELASRGAGHTDPNPMVVIP